MGKFIHKLPEGKINNNLIHKLYLSGKLIENIPNIN